MGVRPASGHRLEPRGRVRGRHGGHRLGLPDLHRARHHPGAPRHPPVAPGDLDVGGARGSQGEGAHRVIPGQVASSGDHLLGLDRKPLGRDPDLGSDAPRIAPGPAESYGQTGRGGLVAVELGRSIQRVEHQIEVAIAVEVGRSHALLDSRGIESPGLGDILEGEVSPIAEGRVGGVEPREQTPHLQQFTRARASPRPLGLGPGGDIHIEHVHLVTIGDQQVFVTVQIDIHEHRGPGPLAGAEPGQSADLGEGAVAPSQKEGVVGELGAIVPDPRLVIPRWHPIHLEAPTAMLPTEHVQHQEVVHTVPIDIGRIDAHGEGAGMTQRQRGRRAEANRATRGSLVDPETVFRLEIVADVEVRPSIARQVPEQHAQSPILGSRIERATRGGREGSPGPRNLGKTATAIVEIQRIDLSILAGTGRGHREPPDQIGLVGGTSVVGHDPLPPVLLPDGILGSRIIPDCHRPVIGHIQIQVTIPIGVGQ